MNRLIACCIALILLTGSASAQWNVEYQQDPPESFNGVYFPTASVGYVVGSGGAIYKSTDSGVTWNQQTSPVTTNLYDVFFTSATEGWAVGASGVIIHTTDGINWNLHAQSGLLTTLDINSIFFLGSYGWMGGDSEDIFRSTDGGTTWYLSAALGSNSEIEGISFVDTLTGYAAVDGDMVAYPTDGGLSYTLSSVNVGPAPYSRFDIEEIYTVDDTTAVATGWGSFVGLQPLLIIVSKDAGVTWNIADPAYNWDIYTYGFGITMFDDGEMMIVGGGVGNCGVILHSTDMVNWSYSPSFTGEDINDVMALPGTNTVVAVGDGGFIARSEDRGYEWSYIGTPSWGFAGWQKLLSYGTRMFGVGGEGFIASFEPDGLGGWNIDTGTLGIDNFASRLYDGAVFPE
ncbi:MAG TPA: YCF48-related protein, partial [Candidatus Krumholzibacterium sp.]|nr:YCF48-related protein [Candidatus Krumholzibacterium sp.]